MSDDDWAIDYLLQTYGSILHINSALAKAEINIVKSSVDGLERFNPTLSVFVSQQPQLKWPNSSIIILNFFKLLQLALTLPA